MTDLIKNDAKDKMEKTLSFFNKIKWTKNW